MAVYFGHISPNTGSTVTITGIPFEPVGVMFWGVHNPLTNISQSFGCVGTDLGQWNLWGGIRQQTSGYLQRHRELRNDSCWTIYSLTNHSILQSNGVLTAFTSDGFSVACTGAGSTTVPLFFMAIGGQNISEAHADTFSTPTSSGIVNVTGTGFTPKALVVAHHLSASLNTQETFFCWGVGVTDGSNQHANFALAPPGSAVTGTHMQRTDAIACAFLSASSYVAELDGFTSDGFDVNVTDPWSGVVEHGYMAIDCAGAHVGTDDFPDSTGLVSYATPGMEPAGVFFTWNGADAPSSSGSTVMPVRPGVGGMDGVLNMPLKEESGTIMGLHRDNAPFGAYQPLQVWDQNAALAIVGAGSQVSPDATTTFSTGEFGLFDMDEFQVDWVVATTNSRQFGWLALPGEIQAPWLPHIYRRPFG